MCVFLISLLTFVFLGTPLWADDTYHIERDATKIDLGLRTKELQELHWGMFICWSFSTFSGSEWTKTQDKDASFFRATGVDTDQWCRTMKEAEMGYVLFLTKHHDGFCLWDTQTTEKKVTHSPLQKDVLAELKKSCDKYGIKLALYFSEGDWDSPDAADGQKQGGGQDAEKKKAQLKELLTQYGPIEFIWFDHAVGVGGLSHEETARFCKELQPGCFIGFNHGDAAGDIRIRERGTPGPTNDPKAAGPYAKASSYDGYRLAEFTYPILPEHKGGASWFYSLPIHDQLVHPADMIYRDYLGAVKYGNIFSLDAGPNYEGKLREVDVATLQQVGKMIREKAPYPTLPGEDSLGWKKAAQASSVWEDNPKYAADKAFDGDNSTRWGAGASERSGSISVDLGRSNSISKVVIKEIQYPRTEKFTIDVRTDENSDWSTVYEGGTIPKDGTITFSPVSARFVRLNILQASGVPTIEEIWIYEK